MRPFGHRRGRRPFHHPPWLDHAHEQAHCHRDRQPRLQRKLFLSFGFAILIAMLVSGVVSHAFETPDAPRPWVRLFALFCAGNVLWGLSGLLARHIARPLRELSRAASELGAGKLESRVAVPHHAAGEVIELSVRFNEMAARIEAQVRSQKELLGAVSHELRTPLARLRVLLGILSDNGATPEVLAYVECEIVEMDALVGELLAGARVDAGALSRRALDVPDLVRTCLERANVPDARADIAHDAAEVHADATLLSRALMVLLDNAQKHGGSDLEIRVVREADETRFSVEDAGPGFDPNDLPQLFAPFARGRGEAPDERRGLGLGLYLVRRIAEAHQGRAFAENRPGGGARVGFSIAHA